MPILGYYTYVKFFQLCSKLHRNYIQVQKHSLFNHTSIVVFQNKGLEMFAKLLLQIFFFSKVLEFYLFIYGTDYRG